MFHNSPHTRDYVNPYSHRGGKRWSERTVEKGRKEVGREGEEFMSTNEVEREDKK